VQTQQQPMHKRTNRHETASFLLERGAGSAGYPATQQAERRNKTATSATQL